MLARARIILKDVTHPGNIGAVARALKTMGLRRLALVAPRASPADAEARARATRAAVEVLEEAATYDELADAIADCTQVFAYTARRRDLSPRRITPREAGEKAREALADGGEVAFVFGSENSGLSNADLQLAGYAVEIPTAASHASLNLAHAVQIAAYELRLSVKAAAAATSGGRRVERERPTLAEFDGMMAHWEDALRAVGLPKNHENRLMLPRLRQILSRAEPDKSEVRLLRGICRAIKIKKGAEKIDDSKR